MAVAWGRASGVAGLVLACAACGSGHAPISFVSNERPSGYAAQGAPSPGAAHQEDPNGNVDVESDDRIEPTRPAADTKQERALVHIHGPKDAVCSGVVLGPRLVATTQRCLRGQPKGVTSFGTSPLYRVEIASSAMTWTNRAVRYAILPHCEEPDLDVAVLVLDEPAPALVAPLKIASAPNTGAHVQALGFGHCPGSKELRERNGAVRSRDSRAVVVDIALCKGDTGGPVLDDGDVIGLISHPDNPEGSPLKTTTIARLDTVWARDLLAQGKLLSESAEASKVDASKVAGVTCK